MEKINLGSDIQRCLESDVLSERERMDLEFIKAFGIPDFLEAADLSCIEKLADFLASIYDKIKTSEIANSVDVEPVNLGGFSRSNVLHKREERRLRKMHHLMRAINLGSDTVYSEHGNVLRTRGNSFEKVCIAKRKLHLMSSSPKIKFKNSEAERCLKVMRRNKYYIKTAKRYEDYNILFGNRYFKNLSFPLENEEIRLLQETPEENSIFVSEKDTVPMNIHRNNHYKQVKLDNGNVTKFYSDQAFVSATNATHKAVHIDLNFIPTSILPHPIHSLLKKFF